MALKIEWTSQAVKGFNKVLDYLEAKWTAREILNLENNIQQVINQIKKQSGTISKIFKKNLFT